MPGDHAPTQGGAIGAVLGVLLRNYRRCACGRSARRRTEEVECLLESLPENPTGHNRTLQKRHRAVRYPPHTSAAFGRLRIYGFTPLPPPPTLRPGHAHPQIKLPPVMSFRKHTGRHRTLWTDTGSTGAARRPAPRTSALRSHEDVFEVSSCVGKLESRLKTQDHKGPLNSRLKITHTS